MGHLPHANFLWPPFKRRVNCERRVLDSTSHEEKPVTAWPKRSCSAVSRPGHRSDRRSPFCRRPRAHIAGQSTTHPAHHFTGSSLRSISPPASPRAGRCPTAIVPRNQRRSCSFLQFPCGEDDQEDTMCPRQAAAGNDVIRVHFREFDLHKSHRLF